MAKTPPKTAASAKGRVSDPPAKPPKGPALAETYAEAQGPGGETHQTATEGTPMLTTSQGAPVADDQNTLRFGARGPALLEDFHFREKIFHFDHERIPERVVHARGYGAHGYFELTESLSDITRADIFQRGEPDERFSALSHPALAGAQHRRARSAKLRRPQAGLLTDGADADLYAALSQAAAKADAVVEVVAPKISGAVLSDGALVPAKQKIEGGPSVLFDAVAVLASTDGAALLARDGAAKDFVNDAFGHCKFIVYSVEAEALFERVGLLADLDEGCFTLQKTKDAQAFVAACADLRYWPREANVDLDAVS